MAGPTTPGGTQDAGKMPALQRDCRRESATTRVTQERPAARLRKALGGQAVLRFAQDKKGALPYKGKLRVDAVNGVEGAPQGVERLVGGREDFFFITEGMLFEPATPGRTMGLIGFFVDGEISEGLG